jgi:HemY protein
MIRVLLYMAGIALVAAGLIVLADRPGEVSITLENWRAETSVTVAIAAVLALIVLAIVAWMILHHTWHAPRRVAQALRRQRAERGLLALSRGLIAIGAGDVGGARKHADAAKRLAPGQPLTLLLAAQTAQLTGDTASAEENFRAMAQHADTRLLGLRGLFIEAQRRGDYAAARLYAEEAAKAAPSLAWAGQAVMQLRCAAGDWEGALESLERDRKSGAIDKATYRRRRAVLLTAQALSLEHSDRDRARALVLEAVKLAPDLIPAAVLAGRFLAEAGELRKASSTIEKAWQAAPHPDLAEVYSNLRFGDSARERLARARTLAAKQPGHVESALAVARAAIDAGEFAEARDAIAPLLAQPTRRVALLMAEIEEREHGDRGRAREWMRRALRAARDPAWMADGMTFERWLPVSPVSGKIDAFQWVAPPPMIAAEPPAEEPLDIPAIEADEVVSAPESPPAAEPPASEPAPKRAEPAAPPPVKAHQIVPVVQVPDDPGPDLDPELDEPPPQKRWRLFG